MTHHPSRRELLRLAALASAFALPAMPLGAAIGGPRGTQAPGVFRFSVGDFAVTVLSDGHLETPAALLGANAHPAEVARFLEAHHLSSEINLAHTNHALIDTGEARVLVDVGSGNRFQPTAGRLMANMAAAGIDPASITHVVLTHAHPDHVWGMLDDFDDPVLPDARLLIGAAEAAFWLAPGRVDQVPEAMKPFVVGAVRSLEPVRDRLELVEDGHEVVPGLRMIATPGHTPGHMSLLAESGGQALLVTGDAANHALISFQRPDWVFGFDSDGARAVLTRRRLAAMAAERGMAVLGYHFPFPGVGHVLAEGPAFRFLPALWRWQ
ncbi:MAG: MBL fold metallo-hydrolase [Paracoccaceae bacterium]|nr:MAG: MBL fold metallo-hydrolase [Paracoccaceae bacterium]